MGLREPAAIGEKAERARKRVDELIIQRHLGKARGASGPAALVGGFIALLAVTVAPVLLVRLPPLVDYPNHLARMAVLSASGPAIGLGTFYSVDWRPLPNLAMDALVPLLVRMMPIEWAGKAFIVLTFALLAGGTMLLHRVLFGRWSAWTLLAFLLLYSRVFIWGFLNFLFGVGLCLTSIAVWIFLRDRALALAIAISSAMALLLYLSHLFALAGYALVIVAYEIGRLRSDDRKGGRTFIRFAAIVPQFILPASLFLLTASGTGGSIEYGRFVRKFDLFFTLFNNYSLTLDAVTFAAALAALAAGLVTGSVVVHRTMVLPLVALLAAHFALPSKILTASGVDHRLPVLLGFIFLASSTPVIAGAATRTVITAAILGFLLVRMAVVASHWRQSDALYTSALAILDHLPTGSRLAVAHPPGLVNVFRDSPPLVHLPTMAVITREAFVPTLFAYASQQPISLRPPYAALAAAAPPEAFWSALVAGNAAPDRVTAALCQYDFIAFVDRQPFRVGPSDILAPETVGESLQLFRTLHRFCPP